MCAEKAPVSEGAERVTYDYDELSSKVAEALRREFPEGLVHTAEGHKGRVRVLIVSKKLDGVSERLKQAYIWEVLQAELGQDARGVSLAIAYGTDELM